MSLIQLRTGRDDGGYTRLFGDPRLGRLLSRVQAAVIAAGSELEKLIIERANCLPDVDAFLRTDIIPDGTYVAPKAALRRSKTLNYAAVEPDFMVFRRRGREHNCYLIELKDGDTFDTKKAAGEKESLTRFMVAIAPHIRYTVSIHFCCFHRTRKEEIVEGFKRKITLAEAMTGAEFCELLGIDREAILAQRVRDQEKNLSYFVQELVKIPKVQEALNDALGLGVVNWADPANE